MLTPIRQRFLSAIGRLTGLREGGMVNPCGEIPAITHPLQPDAPEVDADELARLLRLASDVEVSMSPVSRSLDTLPESIRGTFTRPTPRQ